MKMYSVLINQPAEILGRITVEAESEEDALAIVQEMVDNDDYTDAVEWGETNYIELADVLDDVTEEDSDEDEEEDIETEGANE